MAGATAQQAGTFPVTENIGGLPNLAATIDPTPVLVTATVTRPVLWPATKGNINVGLTVGVLDDTGPPAVRRVEVFSDEPAGAPPYSPDATLVGATLSLRAERNIAGDGRVYLIVARADDPCGVDGLDVRAVIAPLNLTVAHVTALQAAANAAVAACLAANGTPPAGFTQVILPSTALP
jgi:hypothetical protein